MQKIKIEFEGQLKRFSIKKETSFSKLKQEISDFLNVSPQQMNIKYTDDESDIISLSSQKEFEEAIRCSENNILRLQISRKQKKPENQKKPKMKPETKPATKSAIKPEKKPEKKPEAKKIEEIKPEKKPENQRKQFEILFDFPFNIFSLLMKPQFGNFEKKENQNQCFQKKKYFPKFSQPNQTSPDANNEESESNKKTVEQEKKLKRKPNNFCPFLKMFPCDEQKVSSPRKEEKKGSYEGEKEFVVEKKEEKMKEEKKVEKNVLMEKLKILEEMGFYEKEKNTSLLLKHKGEVVQVLRELLD